ncbi:MULTISPECIES: LuxR family transcriptional regulator [unclassified Massilia]|uniref:helix-turn-helix transcriptional regulator n=1 Tax=unclassified Massilia TaxID=2609279 RepID=UPI0017813948|nr:MULTISPECIES: LuxR family transcriptional regulator [unclassified Massilia]MBD8530098.1 LuxR family transcriptional regulator [Massilia sp. CFBP 13647]MBD8674073.1 LuxR family transcriptional regulator [Massilia sp. CFBP 13721]
MIETAQLVQLLEAKDAAQWRRGLFDLAASFGFEQALFGVVHSRHAQFENAFLESNYSPQWREHYDAERLAYVDPTVSHCLTSNLPIIWQPETFNTKEGHALYEEASGYGIRTGVTLPIHGPGGEVGMLSLASDAAPGKGFAREAARSLAELTLIRDYAFASSVQFLHQGGGEAVPRLTRRELEVLNWVMAGKSSWEISMITRCSEATVNFHLANVRQKFNVNTRQQAVVKAISLGLLNPEDRHR